VTKETLAHKARLDHRDPRAPLDRQDLPATKDSWEQLERQVHQVHRVRDREEILDQLELQEIKAQQVLRVFQDVLETLVHLEALVYQASKVL